jgi:hypothetical protein
MLDETAQHAPRNLPPGSLRHSQLVCLAKTIGLNLTLDHDHAR